MKFQFQFNDIIVTIIAHNIYAYLSYKYTPILMIIIIMDITFVNYISNNVNNDCRAVHNFSRQWIVVRCCTSDAPIPPPTQPIACLFRNQTHSI